MTSTSKLKFRPLRVLLLALALDGAAALICGRLPVTEMLSAVLALATVALADGEALFLAELPLGQLGLLWERLLEAVDNLKGRLSWGTRLLLLIALRVLGPLLALGVLAWSGADRWLCTRVHRLLWGRDLDEGKEPSC